VTRPFEHAAQQIVFQEGIDAIEDAVQRLRRLEKQLALIVPEWSMAPVVEAYQAMRGASFLVAVTFAAEIGDLRRFDTPRQLMSFLGLVPGGKLDPRYGPKEGPPPWPATGALVERWSRRPGRITIPPGQRDPQSPVGGAAESRARHRLEGADPTTRPLSSPPPCRRGRDRS
jgi:Transposase IS116/IS110/IS902 family